MHGVGELALPLVVVVPKVAQELSLNKLPMEAQNALEKQQLLNPATLIHAQLALLVTFHDCRFLGNSTLLSFTI